MIRRAQAVLTAAVLGAGLTALAAAPPAAAAFAGPAISDGYVVTTDATGVHWLDPRTRATGMLVPGVSAIGPDISTDGTRVVYATNAGVVDVVDVTTGAVTQLVDLGSGARPPDHPQFDAAGTTVTYDAGGNVYTVPVHGGTPQLIAPSAGYPTFVPGDDVLYVPQGGGSCLVRRYHPGGSSPACLLSVAQARAGIGVDSSFDVHAYDLRVTQGSGDVALDLTWSDGIGRGLNAAAVLPIGGGSVRDLEATATSYAVDEAGTSAFVYSPTLDTPGTTMTYLVQSMADDGAVVSTDVYAVDTATGEHVSPVLTAAAVTGADVYTQFGFGSGGAYVPLPTPKRIVDTRTGLGGFTGRLAAGATFDVATGAPGNAVAAVINLTGVAPTAATNLQAYPAVAGPPPYASNLNLAAGQTAANSVTSALGTGGTVRFRNAVGGVYVVADLLGYYVPVQDTSQPTRSTLQVEDPPQRLFDTRASTPLAPRGYRDIAVRGQAGVPSAATSVVLNVTAIARTAATSVSAYPTPTGANTVGTSTLNLRAGETRANLTTVALPPSGSVRFYNAAGTTDVLADVVGYFRTGTGGSVFVATAPLRIFDTRTGVNEIGGTARIGTQSRADLRSSGTLITTAGEVYVPEFATAVAVNVTAVQPTANTFLSLSGTPASGNPVPAFSSLNAHAGDTVPNAAIVANGDNGQARVYNAAGSVNVVVDLAGYFYDQN